MDLNLQGPRSVRRKCPGRLECTELSRGETGSGRVRRLWVRGETWAEGRGGAQRRQEAELRESGEETHLGVEVGQIASNRKGVPRATSPTSHRGS